MSEGYWVIRTYTAGQVGEKIKYWVNGARPTKSERRLRADILKIQQNEASAAKRLARLLNENCSKGDCFVGLDYSDEGYERVLLRAGDMTELDEEQRLNAIYEAADYEARLFLRRAKRVLDKQGIALRCVLTTSDMDGETGETVRVHHHLVVNAEAFSALLEKWTLGGMELELLSGQPDYTALAEYMIRQVRYAPNRKKYTPTRNLKIPQPKDKIAINGSELRVPKMGQLLQRNEYRPGRPQYIRYILSPAGYPDSAEARGGARQLFGNWGAEEDSSLRSE